MIKNHHWIPDKVYDFFKWDVHDYLPKLDFGIETVLLDYTFAAQKTYATWWMKWQSVYPHTLRYRFTQAICKDDINEIKQCLDLRPSLMEEKLMQGFNALSLASALNKTGIIGYLLFRGANIDQRDYQGRTALIQAVSAWQIEAIKTLVESGANINEKGQYGYDALEISKLKGYEQITKFLETKKQAPHSRRFPRVTINFEFESLLRNQEISDLIKQKNVFQFEPAVHPFNNYGGRYLINLLKHQRLIEKI